MKINLLNQESQIECLVNDMFIDNKLELVKIEYIEESKTQVNFPIVCTSKKQKYTIGRKFNNLVLKTNEGIDVSSFIDLSKLSIYSAAKVYFLTSMFKIAVIRDSYQSLNKRLNTVNILYTNSTGLNPSIKYEDALFDNNYEKIFDKTHCPKAYIKFKRLHDIIDEKLNTNTTIGLTSITGTQVLQGTIAPAINRVGF